MRSREEDQDPGVLNTGTETAGTVLSLHGADGGIVQRWRENAP